MFLYDRWRLVFCWNFFLLILESNSNSNFDFFLIFFSFHSNDLAFDMMGYVCVLLNDIFSTFNGIYMKKKLDSRVSFFILFYLSSILVFWSFIFIFFHSVIIIHHHRSIYIYSSDGPLFSITMIDYWWWWFPYVCVYMCLIIVIFGYVCQPPCAHHWYQCIHWSFEQPNQHNDNDNDWLCLCTICVIKFYHFDSSNIVAVIFVCVCVCVCVIVMKTKK